jgi:ankyrin repeat protein
MSVGKNHTNICMLLLGAGANINLQNKFDATALNQALKYNHKHLIDMLLQNGADVNNNITNNTLTYAIKYGHTDIVKMLTEAGADIDHQIKHDINNLIM